MLTALEDMNQNIKVNPYIFEIKKNIIEFQRRTTNNSKIMFFWVPAHRGIVGNELADTRAKDASLREPTFSIKIPYTDLKQSARVLALNNTETFFLQNCDQKGKAYFESFYKHSIHPGSLSLIFPER